MPSGCWQDLAEVAVWLVQVVLKGQWGSKIEALLRRLLWLQANHPEVKSLVSQSPINPPVHTVVVDLKPAPSAVQKFFKATFRGLRDFRNTRIMLHGIGFVKSKILFILGYRMSTSLSEPCFCKNAEGGRMHLRCAQCGLPGSHRSCAPAR